MCISLMLGLLGTAVSAYGTVAQVNASKDMAKTEEAKMNVEADRHKRSAYRSMIRNQAQSESAASQSGALGGSGIMGGLAQAANSGMQSIRDTTQDQIFYRQQAKAQEDMANGQMWSGAGAGISSLGNQFVKNQEAISRIGQTSSAGKKNQWGTIWDVG